MLKASAGRIYFGVLALASVVVLLAAFNSTILRQGTFRGLTLGFLLGEAVLLVVFSALLFLLHVSLDSKVRISAVLEAFGRNRATRVKEVREDRAVRIARSIPLLNRLAELVERGLMGEGVL